MQDLELSLFLLLAMLTTGVLWLVAGQLGKARLLLLAVPVFCVGASVVWLPPDSARQQLKQEVPIVGRDEFVGSQACRSCHMPHYDSWHQSYHRTMTQLASEESIRAPFDGRDLISKEGRFKVDRQGEWFIAEMPDPDWEAQQFKDGIGSGQSDSAPRVTLPIVMTTGSHHLQAYWVPSEHGNKVRIFPWVYHIDTQRWIPNGDSFILPPHSKRYGQVWNNNCILCHSVAGDVGHEPGNWQSRVAELGISCEACHGPGASHVARHNNPVTRYGQHFSDDADPTIVNPARLSHTKSAEVCGQCHCGFDDDASTPYNQYRAGGDFQKTFQLANSKNPDDVRFWGDGTIRVGGREYNAMIESACYLRGEMSCASCHAMHGSEPDKQMGPLMKTNQACLQCHSPIAQDITAHTHHAAESAGSLCYNCHMPHTSYALFNAIRSHRIDSPNLQMSVEHGRPNACNQCHTDKTLAWTGKHLSDWYKIESPVLSEEQQTLSATLVWLIKGNAIQRVLAVWSLGWEPARQASGDGWQAGFLTPLLDDPYSMVRFKAAESLGKLGIQLDAYDHLQSPDDRGPTAVPQPVWLDDAKSREGLKAFFDSQGNVLQKLLEGLRSQRDEQPITLYE